MTSTLTETPVPHIFDLLIARGFLAETSSAETGPQRSFVIPGSDGPGQRVLFVEPDAPSLRGTPTMVRFWVSSSEDDVEAGLVSHWGDSVFETERDYYGALQALTGPVNVDALSVEELTDLRALPRIPLVHPNVRVYAKLRLDCTRLRLAGRIAEALDIEREAERGLVPAIPAYLRW